MLLLTQMELVDANAAVLGSARAAWDLLDVDAAEWGALRAALSKEIEARCDSGVVRCQQALRWLGVDVTATQTLCRALERPCDLLSIAEEGEAHGVGPVRPSSQPSTTQTRNKAKQSTPWSVLVVVPPKGSESLRHPLWY